MTTEPQLRADRSALKTVTMIQTLEKCPTARSTGTIRSDAPAARPPLVVCHPVWRLECGGLERQLTRCLGAMPTEGLRHHVLVRDGTSRGEIAAASNVTFEFDESGGKDESWCERLADVLRDQGAGLLHVRGLSMVLDAVTAGRRAGVPVAFSFHGFEEWPPRIAPWRREVFRAAILDCADRWAVSSGAARALEHTLCLPLNCVDVSPNGVDADYFAPPAERNDAKRRLSLPPVRLVILCVGNIKPIKGHDTLIRAFTARPELSKQCTLVLAGRDDRDGRARSLAAQLGLTDAIRFAGPVDDPRDWYHAADLFVLPSRFEGMSNALLEAMACGLPVVATAVGGNRDVVIHDENGVLVKPDDPTELADALARLCANEVKRRRLGDAARRHVLGHFSLVRTAGELAERYRAAGRSADSRLKQR